MSQTETNSRVDRTEASPSKFLFALPRFGTSILIGIADFALLFLYQSVYGLPGIYSGLSLMFGKFSIAFSQFFFGWISDKTHTRWGRRKPYIFIMSPILVISFVMLMLPGLFIGSSPDTMQLFAWFAILNSIFQACYAVTTPYQAWLAELFTVDERPRVSAYQNIFNFLGSATMTVFSFVVLTGAKEKILQDPTKIPAEFLYSVLVFGILLIVLFYLTGFAMPTEKPPKTEIKLREILKEVVTNKNFILVTVLQGIASLSWSITSSQILNLVDNVFGFGQIEFIINAGLMIIVLVIGIYFWVKRIDTKGKKPTLLLIFLMGIIVIPFSMVAFIPMDSYLGFSIIYIPMVAICLAGWYIYPYLMYADIAEDDQMKGRELKAGTYTGFPSIMLNIFQAFGLLLSGALLELPPYNFKGGYVTIGYVVWGPIAAAFLVVAYFFAKKFIQLDFEWEKEKKRGSIYSEFLRKNKKNDNTAND